MYTFFCITSFKATILLAPSAKSLLPFLGLNIFTKLASKVGIISKVAIGNKPVSDFSYFWKVFNWSFEKVNNCLYSGVALSPSPSPSNIFIKLSQAEIILLLLWGSIFFLHIVAAALTASCCFLFFPVVGGSLSNWTSDINTKSIKSW